LNVLARAHAISDREMVKPYLMTAVRNLWRNQLRAGRRFEPARDETIFDRLPQPAPEEPSFSGIDNETLQTALQTLSEANAALLALRYVERLDYAAIGERLGITAPTARQRVHRAMEQLRTACFAVEPETANARVCHLTKVRLGRYARGALSSRIAERVTLHLIDCDGCRSVYSDLTDVLGIDPNPEVLPDPDREA
jgi:RNA polymerase sigma factor (sigma-70 family)